MEKGYENTPISDILKVAKISKGAMYHYFESKEEILDAVLLYIIEIDAKSFEPIIQDKELTAWDKLIALMRISPNEISDEVRQASEYTLARPASIFDYRARELSREYSVPILAQIIKEGVVSGEFQTSYPEEMAEMIYAASQSIGVWIQKNPTAEKMMHEIEALSFILGQCLKIDDKKTKQFTNSLKQQVQNFLQQ